MPPGDHLAQQHLVGPRIVSPGRAQRLGEQPGDEIDTGNGGGTFPNGDETAKDDGWAAFSGTSAAAPQLAGVCALIKEVGPSLKPGQVRDILMSSVRDVTVGECHPRFENSAGPGFDLATGAGLVDADAAVRQVEEGGP